MIEKTRVDEHCTEREERASQHQAKKEVEGDTTSTNDIR